VHLEWNYFDEAVLSVLHYSYSYHHCIGKIIGTKLYGFMMGSWYELVVTTCVTTPLGACPLSTHVLCTVTPQPEFSQPHSVQSQEFEFNIVWTRKLGLRCDKIWFNNGGPRTAPYVIAPHLLSSSRQQPWWTLAPSKTNRRCLLTTPTGYTFAVQPLQSIVQKERVKSSHR
jgi:hypothetical protein